MCAAAGSSANIQRMSAERPLRDREHGGTCARTAILCLSFPSQQFMGAFVASADGVRHAALKLVETSVAPLRGYC